MELFHASRKNFKIGQIIPSGNSSTFYPLASSAMDASKPNGAPARKTALYCADSEEFAVYFLKMEKVPEDEINLYKVKVNTFHRAPFSITHVVEKKLNNGDSVDALINEYWNSNKDWNYYEYLVPDFEVIELLEKPALNEMILVHKGGQDHDLAKSIS
jgi:hypothetical protein